MDSLRMNHIADSLSVASRHIEDLNHIYGAHSSYVGEVTSGGLSMVEGGAPISLDLSYSIAVVVLMLLYLIWIGRSLANISNARFKISNPFAPIKSQDGIIAGTTRFGDLALDWSLVVALCALFITKTLDIFQYHIPRFAELTVRITNLGIWLWMAYVSVAFLALIVWGIIQTEVLGHIFKDKNFAVAITTIKSRMLNMAVVWLLPIVLLSALEIRFFAASYLSVAVALMFGALFLYRTFSLFRARKISILHWFLYLCAIEIFPMTLIWGIYVGR